MTPNQEEALYDFLDSVNKDFVLDEAVTYIRKLDPRCSGWLAQELEAFINSRKLAFPKGAGRWVSRRACFEPLSFVITPTRLELVNGILIPGHRCIPFANAGLLPQEYSFFWQQSPVPFTTSEGAPEEFYPYYSIFGEEYAPQYVARDNAENEEAFNNDPFDEPSEVSIKTLDMRNIYRQSSFVPGDRFAVKTLDWSQGHFSLEKVGKDEWSKAELDAWVEAAENGFEESFNKLGPGECTEEQIAFAYWYGAPRMRELPAYALEEFLYEKTNRIETTAYGIETRFWYVGREIPDNKEMAMGEILPDATPVELIMQKLKIPVTEFVIQSYIKDSLFREGGDKALIFERLVPARLELDKSDRNLLEKYISGVLEEFRDLYNPFTDRKIGPIRQRAGELHTALIDLVTRLNKGSIDTAWLPRHTFIILSQIQCHTANVMEDIDCGVPLSEAELEALDNSLDSMVETHDDLKELIDDAMDSFRRNKLALIRSGDNSGIVKEQLIQFSIGGVDVWRRVIVPESCTLKEIHSIIQVIFGWFDSLSFTFGSDKLDLDLQIGELAAANTVELLYEYGVKWTVRIMILSRQETPGKKSVRCVAGSGAAPPEFVAGPLKYRRLLMSLESGSDLERLRARQELGPNFIPGDFDLESCNRNLSLLGEKR